MMIVDPYRARAFAPVAVTYIGETKSGTTTDTQSIPGVAIGPATADRYVFICVQWISSPSPVAPLLTASIGGVAAKVHVNEGSVATGAGALLGAAIISALVPSGTTATVNLTFVSAGFHSVYLETYCVTGLQLDTAIDTIDDTPLGVQPYNGVIDVKKDGLLLVCATTFSAAAGYTMSGVTQDYDNVQGAPGSQVHSVGGSLAVSADELNRAVSISRFGGSGAAFNAAVVAASFR